MRWLRSLLVVSSLAACTSSSVEPAPPSPDGETPPAADDGGAPAVDPVCEAEAAAIQKGIDEERKKQKLQHAGVAVSTERCKSRVFRSDDPASEDVVSDDSLWRMGSVTKTFVSAAILNLAAAGKLGLDDTLDAYVPTFPNASGVTVRQLLNHTSGIFNYTESSDFLDALTAEPKRKYTPAELLAFAASEAPKFEPGTDWYYSNTNYVLLGLVAEKAAGDAIGTIVREQAIEKAGLTRTFFDGEEPLGGALTPGYHAKTDVTNLNDPSCAWAAGAMVATPGDLLAWIKSLYGTDEVLSPASKKELFTFVAKGSYGLGVIRLPASVTLGNGPGVGHGGAIVGYQTQTFWFDETKVGLVSVVSDTNGDPNALSVVVLEALAQ
ncbi:MAG: beta-lactamase family protein [Labilithrix sp.]|nr:beta-lactamase family protein [Labilithrix sp.]MCW5833662.1 beta-lactamase family protein [Labilithrix sp.]